MRNEKPISGNDPKRNYPGEYFDKIAVSIRQHPPSECNFITTALLCFFFVHRFYTGKIWTGILMLIIFGGLLIWDLLIL